MFDLQVWLARLYYSGDPKRPVHCQPELVPLCIKNFDRWAGQHSCQSSDVIRTEKVLDQHFLSTVFNPTKPVVFWTSNYIMNPGYRLFWSIKGWGNCGSLMFAGLLTPIIPDPQIGRQRLMEAGITTFGGSQVSHVYPRRTNNPTFFFKDWTFRVPFSAADNVWTYACHCHT